MLVKHCIVNSAFTGYGRKAGALVPESESSLSHFAWSQVVS